MKIGVIFVPPFVTTCMPTFFLLSYSSKTIKKKKKRKRERDVTSCTSEKIVTK
jgi:hypothetical protein